MPNCRRLEDVSLVGTNIFRNLQRLPCLLKTAQVMERKREGVDFWTNTLKKSQYVVAPMVDQSELAWRLLSRRHGAHLCYTPMYHAASFVRDPQYRSEAMQSCEEDRPLIVQFCANTVDTFLQAALLAEDHCDAIDLNLGCPQAIARRGHYGAFLQDEWDLLKEMVSTCHEKLKVPITCKVRVYESVEETVNYAKMLEAAGCQLLTVHGRTKEQKGPLTGIASWEHIQAVKENVKIPVFANGNIQYLEDVKRCMTETSVEGVMTAEGNLHNPALFEGVSPPVWEMAEEYLKIVEEYPCPLSYVRGHLFKMCHHVFLRHTDCRDELAKSKSLAAIKAVVLMTKNILQSVREKNQSDSPEVLTNQKLPYWLCQPYVRPSPEDAKKKQLICAEESRKRQTCEEVINSTISKKKLKRMKRYPNRNFETRGKQNYEPCAQCKNPRGEKCVHQMCRPCCKTKAWTEKLDCVGHNILVKTKRDKKLAHDAQRQLSQPQ